MKKIFFRVVSLFSVLLLLSFATQAQDKQLIAQLEQQLPSAKDEGKVDILNKIVAEYLKTTAEVSDDYWNLPQKYAKDAVDLAEKLKYKRGMAEGYTNLSEVYNKKNIKPMYLKYKYKATQLYDEVAKTKEQEAKEAQKEKELKEAEVKRQQEELDRQMEEAKRKQKEIEKLSQDNTVSKEEIERKKRELAQSQNEIVRKQEEIYQKDVVIHKTEEQLEVERIKAKYQSDSIQILVQEAMIKDLEVSKEKEKRKYLIGIIASMGGIALMLFFLYQTIRRTAKQLEEKNRIIEEEKRRSDELLLNILPLELANELKEKGMAEARNYDMVTVLFTDFKDFTKISEKLTPKQLVDEIDYAFRAFDDIIGKYNIEKIKTVGDAYLCAGGIPMKETHDPIKVVSAALDIQHFMERLKRQRQAENRPFFEIRIGVHSGPLVAGVVGSKKFAYDIWGDTVNTAARMEQNSEPGRVNISEATYELIKGEFSCTYRGKLYAKNKGEIDMYFVDKKNT